jgi:non-ribosomal peptide synthetase component E (peptide arylation enzyme)
MIYASRAHFNECKKRGSEKKTAMYLTQALHRSVQQHPDKVATHFAGRSLNFLALRDRVARLAAA